MKTFVLFCALLLATASSPARAADKAYADGPVSQVSAIKIVQGHFDDYMGYIASQWKPEQEVLKKAGLITGYAIYSADARTPNDPDLYLVVTYANYAALDGFNDRSDAAIEKALGADRTKVQKGVVERNAYRTVMGMETIQELKFK